MRWVEEIKIGAAREFGGRHMALILWLAVLRRAVPWALSLAALAVVVWWVTAVALPWLVFSAVCMAVGIGTWQAWRWWYPSAAMGRVPVLPIVVIIMSSIAGTALAMWAL